MFITILLRDIFITFFRFFGIARGVSVPARRSGKHKLILQVGGIFAILGYLAIAESTLWNAEWANPAIRIIHYWMIVIILITWSSAIRYARKNWKRIYARAY